jgi:hypothetical protein
MADDLSVSRVTEPVRDGKSGANPRGKRRAPAPRPSKPAESAEESPASEAPKERHLDFLV